MTVKQQQPTQPLPLITGFGHTKDGRDIYTVASRSKPGAFHIVTMRNHQPTCDCEAAHYGKRCSHIEAVQARVRAKKPITATTSEYREPSFRDSAPLFRDNQPFSIFASTGGDPR